MKPSIWLPLFIGDYLRDTQHLTTEQHGAYLLLLMHAWTSAGKLPVDDGQLAKISGLDPKSWRRHRATILSFFTLNGEGYIQKRLLLEYERAVQVQKARSEIGKLGASERARRRGHATDGGTHG